MTPWHDRIATTLPQIAGSPDSYLSRFIRPQLCAASDDGRLEVGRHIISKHVRVAPSPKEPHLAQLIGGRRNMKRRQDLVDLRMADGGWIFFAATLRPTSGGLELISYDVERVFGEGSVPPWVRFDFNADDHSNVKRGLRSHMHPGNEDLQLPAPIFAPHELLEMFLGDSLGPRGGRSPRGVTPAGIAGLAIDASDHNP